MGKGHAITAGPLSAAAFGPYGRLVAAGDDQPPDFTGKDWQCWYPLGELQAAGPPAIGLVRAKPGDMAVLEMERHPHRSEWVFAIDGPVIQSVALSGGENPERPDPQQARAFVIQPGQGVLISAGVWHAAGLAAGRAVLYGFVLSQPSERDLAIEEGMVPFDKGEYLDVAL